MSGLGLLGARVGPDLYGLRARLALGLGPAHEAVAPLQLQGPLSSRDGATNCQRPL